VRTVTEQLPDRREISLFDFGQQVMVETARVNRMPRTAAKHYGYHQNQTNGWRAS